MATLSILDQAFIYLESESTPMHIGGLMMLTPPEGKEDFATELHQWLTQEGEVGAPYNRKLKMELGAMPQWVKARDIDINDHIKRIRLPEPGTREQLLELVSELASRVMDRSRPLWDGYVIDGLESGEVAFYVRLHHSLADGVRANKLLADSCALSPDEDKAPFWAGVQKDATNKRGKDNPLLELLSPKLWQKQLSTSTGLVRLAGKMALDWCNLVPSSLKLPFTAPRTPFNKQHDHTRAAVTVQVPWQRLRRLAKLTDTSTNDVVLTLCDITLRRYLDANDWTRQQPLVTLMPINMREGDTTSKSSNQVTMGTVELGTRDAAPLARLKAINEGTLGLKSEALRLSRDAYSQYALVANGISWIAPRLGLNKLVPPITNMVISNVPGPRDVLFLKGAKMTEMLPISLLAPGQSLNITMVSYNGNLGFSFLYCESALPGFAVVADHLKDALEELEQATLDSYSEVLALAKAELEKKDPVELETVVVGEDEAPLARKAS